MHLPDYTPANLNTTAPSGFIAAQVSVEFSSKQRLAPPIERRLDVLIAEKVARREFFYGIELVARSSYGKPTVLDYNRFGALLPLFTSLVWLGQDYANIDPIADVEAIRCAQELQPHTIVVPHFSSYRVDHRRLSEFLALNFSNVLAVRGDQVAEGQQYKHAADLVADIRRLRNDTISIGVGGYPDGHPDSQSLEEDLQFQLTKINSGADYIITQICFSAERIIRFVKNCRANGILVPIIVGVFVPDNLRTLERVIEIAHVRMDDDKLAQYRAFDGKASEFRDYAVTEAVEMLTKILHSDVGVYGVQFFSMNRFKNIHRVLQRIVSSTSSENVIEV